MLQKSLPHRRATSALRVSYQRSPRCDDSLRIRRPASTVSPCGSTTTTTSSSSSWYADILPYKPSTLPATLADRLKQRNSFILSSLGQSQPPEDLMTRSLFESRQASETTPRRLPSRSASRSRPVSFHDTTSTTINLPSLDHLLKPTDGSTAIPKSPETTSPLKGSLLHEPYQIHPSDSPQLGQYCRLKLVIPPPSNSSSRPTSRSDQTDTCSTFL